MFLICVWASSWLIGVKIWIVADFPPALVDMLSAKFSKAWLDWWLKRLAGPGFVFQSHSHIPLFHTSHWIDHRPLKVGVKNCSDNSQSGYLYPELFQKCLDQKHTNWQCYSLNNRVTTYDFACGVCWCQKHLKMEERCSRRRLMGLGPGWTGLCCVGF